MKQLPNKVLPNGYSYLRNLNKADLITYLDGILNSYVNSKGDKYTFLWEPFKQGIIKINVNNYKSITITSKEGLIKLIAIVLNNDLEKII